MESALTGLTSHLTKRVALIVLVPAVVFWLGGTAAIFWYDRESWWGWGLASFLKGSDGAIFALQSRLAGLSLGQQLVLLVGVALASALVVELFVLDVLQLLEGYWPQWLKWLLRGQVAHKEQWELQARTRYEDLHEHFDNLNAAELQELRGLEVRLTIRASPRRPKPTQLGDILAGAETRPNDKYGLNVGFCFPRLWLVMPEGTRTELTSAREALDTGARVWLWGVLFIAWVVVAWWAPLLGILVAWLSYRAAVGAARNYGDLLESAFDLHHTALFQALRWPLPTDPKEERVAGEGVTQYLVYVERRSVPKFAGPASSTESDSPARAQSPRNEDEATGEEL